MGWTDEDRIMISALEHYSYCPRQCALIHLEDSYAENLYTLRGSRAHVRVDRPEGRHPGGVRVERALPLWSDRLGLVGRADVVEYHEGTPYPVEYKYGRKRPHDHAEVQLCAQALCLEEMTGKPVPAGALFFTESHRRREVEMAKELRRAVEQMVAEVRAMLAACHVPPPVNDARCRKCSLKQVCMPDAVAAQARQRWWAGRLFRTSGK